MDIVPGDIIDIRTVFVPDSRRPKVIGISHERKELATRPCRDASQSSAIPFSSVLSTGRGPKISFVSLSGPDGVNASTGL